MDETETEREGRVIRRIPTDTFAHRLLLSRAEHGLTIEQAAAKCGLLSQSWGGWERGRLPRDIRDVADAVSEGLGIDRDWLLHGGPLTRPNKTQRVRVTYRTHSGPGRTLRRPRRVDGARLRVPA